MGRRIRFRATDAQIALQVGPLGFWWVVVLGVLGRGGVASANLVALAVTAVASMVGAVALLRWRGLELTADHLVLRGDLVRRIPWSEVLDVRARRRWGTNVVLVETAERTRRCTAPITGLIAVDPHFDAKVAFVQRWWMACAPAEVRARAQSDGRVGWGQPVCGVGVDPT